MSGPFRSLFVQLFAARVIFAREFCRLTRDLLCLQQEKITQIMKKLIITLAAALCAVSLAAQPRLTADNIDEILAAMTLEEKATLLVGGGWGSMTAGALTASNETLVSGADDSIHTSTVVEI